MPTHHNTCPDCGAPAPQTDQSFCDSCGAFLRWDRPAPPSPTADPQRTAGPAHPAPAAPAANGPEPTPGPGAPNHPGQSGAATPPTTPPATPAATPPPAATPAAAGPQQGAAPDSPAGSHSQEAPDAVRPPRAGGVSDTGIRALLVPVPGSSPTPPPEAPGQVLPGRPEAARPRVRTPQTAPEPEHGAPCPSCGALNAPGRHFCRSCASPLADTAREAAEGPYAGERPRLHRDRTTRWITRAVVAAVIAAVVVGGIIGGPPAARAVQDHFAKRVPVPATAWTASHSGSKHAAKLAFDGYSNTWWGTGYSGNSDGQYLEARFGQPTDLLNVLITPGASARTPQAADPARPHEFDLIVTDSAGKQHISHPRINDGGVQKIDVAVREAMTVRLVLHSAYGAAKNKQVAIAELEFFGRSAR